LATIPSTVASSGVRFKLLSYLVSTPRTPTELASLEKKHVSHVSRALSELRTMGLVESMETGSRERVYRSTDRGYLLFLMISRSTR
jgi:DNA-binding transcriptional ArsR family regulator